MVLNERRTTQHGGIWGRARRDGLIFSQPGVTQLVRTMSTHRIVCLGLQKKMGSVAAVAVCVSRP